MRLPVTAAALVAIGVLLTGCDSVAPAFACKVDVTTADLVADREAVGVESCTEIATSAAKADANGLPDLALDCLGEKASIRLDQIQGPAIINFWASNCAPCRKEMPALQAFHEKYGDQVAMIGVNYLDTYPGAAIDLARLTGATYPSVADACGDLQETNLELGVGLPFFLFVNEDGDVSRPHVGGVTTVEEVVAMVKDELDIDLTDGGAR